MPNMNAASPANFSIELVTGRVHPTGGQGTARSILRQRTNVIVAFGRALKLNGVWKTPQHRIMTRRLKIFDGATEDQVKGRSGVHDVEIERHQITAEVQLRIVIQRAAAIRLQSLRHRPADVLASCTQAWRGNRRSWRASVRGASSACSARGCIRRKKKRLTSHDSSPENLLAPPGKLCFAARIFSGWRTKRLPPTAHLRSVRRQDGLRQPRSQP